MIYSHTMGPAYPANLLLIEALMKFNKRIKAVEFINKISRIIEFVYWKQLEK